jgi:hypothetical protein
MKTAFYRYLGIALLLAATAGPHLFGVIWSG